MPETSPVTLSLQEQAVLVARAGLFDADFYVQDNPDLADCGLSPLAHFCQQGWRQLRNPSAGFNLWWYWIKHLGGDTDAVNPCVHYASLGHAQGLSINASQGGLATSAEKAAFNLTSMALLRALPADAGAYTRIARSLIQLGAWDLAEIAADKAVAAAPENADYLYRLGEVLAVRQNWWRACEVLAAAVRLDATHANWFARLGGAHVQMGRFAEAAEAYRLALNLEPDNAQLFYRLGRALEKNRDADAAVASFQKALELDAREDVQRLGLGVLHQENGDWHEAVLAFASLAGERNDGELHYRHGFALEHCYRWGEALAAYQRALQTQACPEWYYRYGCVLERLGRYGDAAQAYALALRETNTADWRYRLGYTLYCAGDYAGACAAWQQMDDQDAGLTEAELEESDAERYFRWGSSCELERDWQGAAEAYGAAVARCNVHTPSGYYRLGTALFKAGRLQEACEAFAEVRLFKRLSLIEANRADVKQEFAEFTATLPLRRRVVMYESFSGQALSCNPYAIFRHLLKRPEYEGWLHVWAVKRRDSVPHTYRSLPNVIIVEYESSLYRRYLATAQYLINNLWFPVYYSRREGQQYLNTWHGTPLKNLGKNVPGSFLAYKNTARNFLQATHLISPNAHTSGMLFDSYDVAGLLSAQLAETGYPRVDAVYGDTSARELLRQRLNIADERPVVLYAPTWRGTTDRFDDAVGSIVDTLNKLAGSDCNLVFRGHHFVEQAILCETLPVAVATADIDSCELLSIVDVLITDYSSIFFDFLPTRRPILYYAYDLAAYQDVQGPLCFALSDMPGRVCHDLPELQHALAEQLEGGCAFDEVYRDALARFCPHEDGQSSARAVAFFFEGSQTHRIAQKGARPLLFHLGVFAPNGITASALNLLAVLDERGDTLAVTVDPWNLESFPARREKLACLPADARVLARAGHMVLSADEQWLVERFNARREVDDESIWPVLKTLYQREFQRLFGDTQFAAVIDFSGYNPYWSSLFALGAGERSKLIYLHADMPEEQRVRYPALVTQFRLYRYFDALVSVSAARRDEHRMALAEPFRIAPDHFQACDNMINAEAILRRSEQPLEARLAPWFEGVSSFLALGRLSPEKGHAKLVSAFARLVADFPEARLVIAGDGPLRGELERQLRHLGLSQCILLAGQCSNPFSLLAHARCCVLPSDYEGQPMVLLEAMVLQRPIIATDIEACRAVLADGYGALAANSEAGLAQAMSDFLRNGQAVRPFDVDAYQRKALAGFDRLLERSAVHD